MSETEQLKAELDKVKNELAAHKVMISTLLLHIAEPGNRMDLISKISKLTESLDMSAEKNVGTHIGYFSKQLFELSKHK
ncbi:hypothetical protein KKI95_16095 [Xenorhabdus bovienii]|uniref:hypothetical protein n=1 Tax=Xenorhabdus bovienii TaxID=40576 RepID=UPI00237D25A2|nr:hypothetical protein [Xenorhabdus bovienii]MDE1494505.1 hypothetical protein [Xenorhabdus bovienii]MDE9437409.1 hypothetical protein [Xenorhabdus bovienii]MDE9455312.1 hypothetical protein [Xenorhabdus bovienii]MDE9464637.1 hypothetical protein [Xenorhabdus bovienii]MDE9472647.1 hypothetical protein [Xenorhabdus bovienii]